MPKAVFTDSEPKQFQLLKKGTYAYEVVKFDSGIQGGTGKTKGSENMEITIAVSEQPDGPKLTTWKERFIFHDSTQWKVDVFTKSANLLIEGKPPIKGQEIEYSEDTIIGLRGWCDVEPEADQHNDGKPESEKRFYNRVTVWRTDKPKLPRIQPEAKEDCPF